MIVTRERSLDVNSAGHQIGGTGTDDSGGGDREREEIMYTFTLLHLYTFTLLDFYTCFVQCALSNETVQCAIVCYRVSQCATGATGTTGARMCYSVLQCAVD